MPTRTTVLALRAGASLGLAGCSSSGSSDSTPKHSTTAATVQAAPTAAAAYNPQTWRARVNTLITNLDQARPGCTQHPSSSACATALQGADTKILAMNQAITDAGAATRYPATEDHIQRNILAGYNDYVNAGCGSDDPTTDEDCRGPMVQVMLAVATLPSKMTADG